MGYTPLFDTLTRGTLCGKWPDIGLWAVVLSMADWRGHIEATPQYIATVTGLPVGDVRACMKRFTEPDSESHSNAEGGRRLALLDEHRDWGWRVVNIQLYRRKCSDVDQVLDGRNAEKVRRYKERHRETPQDTEGHRETLTHTHTQTKNKSLVNSPSAFDRFWSLYPKKVKKKPAVEIWKRKSLDRLADAILEDIPKRLESDERWRRGFAPDPTTYLTQERWNDEFKATEPRRWE